MALVYIFDLDDTLVDSSIYSKMHHELLSEIVKQLKIGEIDLERHISKLKEESGRQKIDTFELCKDLKCIELYYEVLEKYARHTYCLKYREIPSIFKRIKDAKKKIGVVSNSQERTIRFFLGMFNLMDLVDFIESGKKNTVLFWIQLENRHNLYKGETLVIDDSEAVLKIAEDAGYQVMDSKKMKDLEKMAL